MYRETLYQNFAIIILLSLVALFERNTNIFVFHLMLVVFYSLKTKKWTSLFEWQVVRDVQGHRMKFV